MTVLIDTNFLLAVTWTGDANHAAARSVMRESRDRRIIPAPVLPELFYMLVARTNYQSAIRVFGTLRSKSFQIEVLTDSDMARMQEIMTNYVDNQFDFVDTAIMALSERLIITTVYTLDRRDFSVFRPKHCSYLKLLP